MNIRAVIIDDEYLSIEELSFLLSEIPSIEVVGTADCGVDGLNLIQKLEPDLAFIDVKMPDITGIELSRKLNVLNSNCKIIFTTAYDQYAIEAFDVNAIDYILKPYDEERVLKAVSKAKKIIENDYLSDQKVLTTNAATNINKLPVMKNDKLLLIDIEDILLIYTEDRHIFIKTSTETFNTTYSLQELEERLRDKGFFRTHRSYLVNLNKIKEVSPWFNGSYIVIIEGIKKEIPISRSQVKAFKRILGI